MNQLTKKILLIINIDKYYQYRKPFKIDELYKININGQIIKLYINMLLPETGGDYLDHFFFI